MADSGSWTGLPSESAMKKAGNKYVEVISRPLEGKVTSTAFRSILNLDGRILFLLIGLIILICLILPLVLLDLSIVGRWHGTYIYEEGTERLWGSMTNLEETCPTEQQIFVDYIWPTSRYKTGRLVPGSCSVEMRNSWGWQW